jgi:hypothetical protein
LTITQQVLQMLQKNIDLHLVYIFCQSTFATWNPTSYNLIFLGYLCRLSPSHRQSQNFSPTVQSCALDSQYLAKWPGGTLCSKPQAPSNQRLFPCNCPSYLPDTPSASSYGLYQFVVINLITQSRNELEYFWNRASWTLADLPDPGLVTDLSSNKAKLCKAVMAGLTRIMKLAYNRLISLGYHETHQP